MPKLTVKKRRQPVKKHDKQHNPRAESFRRIAKAIRSLEPELGRNDYHMLENLVKAIARIFDAEAKLLRSLR